MSSVQTSSLSQTWYIVRKKESMYLRDFCRDSGLTFLILLPVFLLSWHNLTGDGCTYFTFIKNFFTLPFSFQPDTVSFGATSPLHVVVHGMVYRLFGAHLWLCASKLLNYCFIVVGVVFLQRSIAANMTTLLIVAAVATLNLDMFRCAAQMYETSLAFCAMSLLYLLIKNRHIEAAVLLSGTLYLIRPELILITATIDIYAFVTYLYSNPPGSIARLMALIVVSMIPTVIYHLYMFTYTHELLPSSILNKQIRSLEVSASWIQRVLAPIAALKSKNGLISLGFLTRDLIWITGAVSIGVGIIQRSVPCTKEDLMLILPLITLFTLFPAGAAPTIRYLSPASPVIIVIIVVAVREHLTKLRDLLGPSEGMLWKRSWLHFGYLSVVLLAVATTSAGYVHDFRHPAGDYDTVLQLDLARKLNPITTREDKILLYEIQGQYYLKASCYSMDCMVGSQLHDVLRGKDSFENFIAMNGVGFIVTMNGINYRKIFKNTLLMALYLHDLSSKIGDSIDIEGITFKKIFTNPMFSDPHLFRYKKRKNLNVGYALRVCGDWNKLFAGEHPQWNSVYAVERRPGSNGRGQRGN